MRQITHPDGPAADFVFIGGSDPASGRADLAGTGSRLAQSVKITVQRQDQRAIVGKRKVVWIDFHALRGQLFNLGLQCPGVEHHAIADDRQRAGHDPRWQQAELVDLVTHHQRMPCVVATLKAHHRIGTAGQPVDDLAFALIAPLGADHGNICHGYTLSPAG